MALEKRDRKDKPSKVEKAKEESNHLRGSIREVLESGAKGFEHDDMQLLKFHGIYQGEDRDSRILTRLTGQEQPNRFMIRLKVPGGRITPDQYLAMDKLADEVTYNASLRGTTRQAFQLHGVLKGDLKKTMQRINEILMSTLCGCGDVERNIMAPPALAHIPINQALNQLTDELADALVPKTNAYYEVWLDNEKIDTSQEKEDIYGDLYLPRKFKTGVALPQDNCADVYSQDAGIIAVVKDDKIIGANILVGGGQGMTHKKPETYARLGSELGYVDAEHIVKTVQTIATIFRDYGDRSDRKHARLKYIIQEQGIEAFREAFKGRVDFELKPWADTPKLQHQYWFGKHDQGDGKWFYGLFVPNGRVIDRETDRYKTAFKTIVESLRPQIVLTPNQNVIFADLTEEQIDTLERIVDTFHIPRSGARTAFAESAMACPALPTCSLALTESERVIDHVVAELEAVFAEHGVDDVPLTIRMTGCPNGCARPYTADIGLVGHKPGHYDVFLGGTRHGHRMAELFAANVPVEDLPKRLAPLIAKFGSDRMPDEEFGEFYNRVFADNAHRHLATGDREKTAEQRVLALV